MLTSQAFPALPGAQWVAGFAFTDRQGGLSRPPYDSCNLSPYQGDDLQAVRANRALVASAIGVEHVAYMRQVHGDTVRVVQHSPSDLLDDQSDCDCLLTSHPGLAVAVLVADCVPVLLADLRAGVVAAVHAGRQGVLRQVVVAAVEQMVTLGASPQHIHARLGPSICGRCYEVPHHMAEQVAQVAPQALTTTRSGTPGLDLRQGLVGVLAGLGVAEAVTVGGCSQEGKQFYSYRRDQAVGQPTGRMAGLVWLHPQAQAG